MSANKNIIITGLLMCTILIPSAHAQEIPSETTQQDAVASEDTTIVYDREFFSQFNNLITAMNMVDRVPGASNLVGGGGGNGGGGRRGFGSNNDFVLINGKRLSGKSNSSRDALNRIPAEQVLRIEIIRGSSPDVKVSSQQSFLNVVLSADSQKISGTWQVQGQMTESGRFVPGMKASVSGSKGSVEYFLEANWRKFINDNSRTEEDFDANYTPLSYQYEETKHRWRGMTLSSNLTFNLNNGDQIRLNGKYDHEKNRRNWFGEEYSYDTFGALTLDGENVRYHTSKGPSWEVGGDYETDVGEKTSFKILALYSTSDRGSFTSEDALIESDPPQVDFDFHYFSKSSEAIARPSFTWALADGQQIEFGNEIAINKIDTRLDFYSLEGGSLVRQDIDNSISSVKETRSETFVNYSWKLSEKWNLESSLTYEWSKISAVSESSENSQTLSYLKPTLDLRYDMTDRDQLQFSIRRDVSQLNFGSFASSVTGDDEVVGGNNELRPQKSWLFETSYEHRLNNDMGRIKIGIEHGEFYDNLTRIEVAPGVPALGNFGRANRTIFEWDSSIRLGFLGNKDMRLDNRFAYRLGKYDNSFTGQRERLNGFEKYQVRTEFRHDVNKHGLTYGFFLWLFSPEDDLDIDEIRRQPQWRTHMGANIEKKIFSNMVLRFSVDNLLNQNRLRIRELYDAGIATNILTGVEERREVQGRRFNLSLKSTF